MAIRRGACSSNCSGSPGRNSVYPGEVVNYLIPTAIAWLALQACGGHTQSPQPSAASQNPNKSEKELPAEKLRREARRLQQQEDERRSRDEFIHRQDALKR